jgi:hypothetical protein
MKRTKIIIFIIFIAIAASYIVYTYPKHLTKEFDGILYRLGDSDKEYASKVKVTFSGVYSKNFIFGNNFKGDIFINGSKVDVNEVKFDKYNRGILGRYYNENTGENVLLSMIIMDSNFNKFTIAVDDLHSKTEDSESYTWSTNEGLVITAPAKNRSEALNITKEIFSKYLHIPVINTK